MANIHLQTTFRNIRRSPFQAMAAVLVLSITFFVISVVSILLYSSDQFLQYVETRPQILAFLNKEAAPEKTAELHNRLKNDPRVTKVVYVTQEEALELYKTKTQKNPLLSELVSPTVFPASLEFSVKNLGDAESLINELKNESVVDDIGFTASFGDDKELSEEINKIRQAGWYIRVGGSVFAAFQVTASFLVLALVIGIRLTTRRGEIEILNLIGATPGFIRSPIILEALVYSALGVILGWVMALLLVLYAAPSLLAYFEGIPILPRDTGGVLTLFGAIGAIELFAGMMLGLVGSSLAVSRVRRRK